MASMVLTNGYISIGGNDLSAYCNGINLDYNVDTPDDTAMGDDTKSVMAGGLKDWTLKGDFNQDFGAGLLDAILFPLVGTAVAVEVRPDAGAVSTSNPKFTGTGILTGYAPIGGKVGDKAAISITVKPGGSTPTLSRATS